MGGDRPCLSSLGRDPLPLYSDLLDVAVLWSARAACTFAIKWLFFQEGRLEEALAYSPWPHHYRQHVYCRRPGYLRSVQRIPDLGPRALKFVRHPLDRAVGSYLAFSRQAFRNTDAQHTWMLRLVGHHLGRKLGDGGLLTFREFVDFLGSIDLAEADIHVRPQVHPSELRCALPELTVIRVEEVRRELPRIEVRFGLLPSDIEGLRRSAHDSARVAWPTFAGDTPFGDAASRAVPVSSAFYDPALEAEVRRLYAADFARYGYEGRPR